VFRILGIVAALLLTSACASDGSPVESGSRVRSPNGVSVVMPHGWESDTASAARLTAFVHGRWIDERCSEGDAAHVGMQLDVVPPSLAANQTFGRRPPHFTAESGSGVTSGAADQPCGSSSQTIRFVENGRYIDVYVTFGAAANEGDRAAVYELLDGLRVAPVA
jgi:hypothetical protein